jgi:Mu transposase, C-terminal domain
VASVTRKVDASGNVSFAGANYRVGSKYKRRQVQVAVLNDTVEISIGNELIRSHRVKHDRTPNTALSPTPAADPTAPTPHEGSTRQAPTGVEVSDGYRVLT